jgi:membrane protein implicated in regulation of membrane protease activity
MNGALPPYRHEMLCLLAGLVLLAIALTLPGCAFLASPAGAALATGTGIAAGAAGIFSESISGVKTLFDLKHEEKEEGP